MERVKITGEIEISPKKLAQIQEKVINVVEFRKKIEEFLESSATELLETILAGAVFLNLSDIHIEPEEERIKLRGRMDGVLHDIVILNLKTYQALLSRIKLLSALKLNVVDRPQDGRFTISMAETTVEIRTSTLPAEYGEAIVLRLLNPKNLIEVGK